MLFKRRKRLSVAMRLRLALWPARSFRRSLRYRMLRLLRIEASPHSLALGSALGVFAVFTPFLGFQMTIAALLAFTLRGSVVASAASSFVGNPLTYPAIWVSTFTVGSLLLDSPASADIGRLSDGAEALGRSIGAASADGVANAVQYMWPVLKPMALGSLPVGGLTALMTYFLVRQLAAAPGRTVPAAGKRSRRAHP